MVGKCYCSKLCNGKGDGDGNGNCKKITISTFQSGSVKSQEELKWNK